MVDELEKLRRAVKSEREFVNLAAHQLQEPLASMNWIIESLLAGKSGTLMPKQRENMAKLSAINGDTIRLIDDLLSVARIEGGRLKLDPTETDLVVLVRKIIKRHDADIKKNSGAMYFRAPKEPLPSISVDVTLLSQAIDNLISNAIKYNPVKTHVTVMVSRGKMQKLTQNNAEDNWVTIVFNNRGPLIPKEKQPTLFQKFGRVETKKTQRTKGTGLGLYITKQIVELHGGEIGLESSKGEGTSFFITLPMN